MHATTLLIQSLAATTWLMLSASTVSAKPTLHTWTDPETAQEEDPDFRIQGEYGSVDRPVPWGAQVVALGAGHFDAHLYRGGLPGAGWEPGGDRLKLTGKRAGSELVFSGEDTPITASLSGTRLEIVDDGKEVFLPKLNRRSPTQGATAPEGALILFDGSSTAEWTGARIENGLLQATGATTKRTFGDYRLHLEFRTPYMPHARGQKRGNSGVYHSGRWETQILDSFGLSGRDNHCGGIYSISKPRLNMCLPPLAWQTYDVEFTAARFDAEGQRTAWPRITVRLNGVLVHENLELAKDFTTSAPITSPLTDPEGPVFLQNHKDPVAFRNIWIVAD